MDSSTSALTPLQRDLLDAFFNHEPGFFLTGGAALAGYYLGHRRTKDLDLFTADQAAFERGAPALRAAAETLGATTENVRTAPAFRRLVVTRGSEALVVDLVLDPTPQLMADKRRFGHVMVDPLEEIAANKLCALLSRSELRDLVDLWFLNQAGYPPLGFVEAAKRKDAGFTPAALAHLLREVRIGETAALPEGLSAPALRSFLEMMIEELTKLAFPKGQ
jgi:predicted nucleotidyltransferase component of viral defense system